MGKNRSISISKNNLTCKPSCSSNAKNTFARSSAYKKNDNKNKKK